MAIQKKWEFFYPVSYRFPNAENYKQRYSEYFGNCFNDENINGQASDG